MLTFSFATYLLQVPVYKGPLKSIVSQDREDSRFHHGSDGMGGVQHPSTPDLSIIKSTPAPMEIRELVNKYPGLSKFTYLNSETMD